MSHSTIRKSDGTMHRLFREQRRIDTPAHPGDVAALGLLAVLLAVACLPRVADAVVVRRQGGGAPPKPPSVRLIPRPVEANMTEEAWAAVSLPPPEYPPAGTRIPIIDYLRCVYSMAEMVDPVNRRFLPIPTQRRRKRLGRGTRVADPQLLASGGSGAEDGGRAGEESASTGHNGHSSSSSSSKRWTATPPAWCRPRWIPRHEWLAGLDSVVLLGDSTLLRMFQDMFAVSTFIYEQKVLTIDESLNGTVRLQGGRVVKVFFVRMLYVADQPVLDRLFDPHHNIVTARTLIITTFGAHDMKWQVFRQPPPFFRKSQIGRWPYARKYWNRFAGSMIDHLAHLLDGFSQPPTGMAVLDSEESAGGAEKPASSVPLPQEGRASVQARVRYLEARRFGMPVVVHRDMVIPPCSHPKYQLRPYIKCTELLEPLVVPWYRSTLTATLGLRMAVPTVSMDATQPPCGLVDAGHFCRWCNEVELQLALQAFRLTRVLGVPQRPKTAAARRRSSASDMLDVGYIKDAYAAITAPYYDLSAPSGEGAVAGGQGLATTAEDESSDAKGGVSSGGSGTGGGGGGGGGGGRGGPTVENFADPLNTFPMQSAGDRDLVLAEFTDPREHAVTWALDSAKTGRIVRAELAKWAPSDADATACASERDSADVVGPAAGGRGQTTRPPRPPPPVLRSGCLDYAQQPSQHRWGYYLNVTEVVLAEAPAAAALVVGLTQADVALGVDPRLPVLQGSKQPNAAARPSSSTAGRPSLQASGPIFADSLKDDTPVILLAVAIALLGALFAGSRWYLRHRRS